MKNIYFQLVGGAAGDMLLTALIGLGCPLSYLKKEFKKLNLNCNIQLKTIKKGYSGKELIFKGKYNLSYKEIVKLIKNSKLDNDIKIKVLGTYKLIFKVEKKIHKIKGNNFCFHHLGEIDAILEICGFYLGLKYLKIENIYISPFPLGNPAPAVLEILKNNRVSIVNFGYETVTPTAAALLKDARQNSRLFVFEKSSMAFGHCGENDYLVAYLIDVGVRSAVEPPRRGREIEQDKIIKIETNIDDMNPQIFEPLFDTLYKNGAKEVYVEHVMMKKTRPAFILNILCAPEDFIKIRNIIFSHTSTFGIRYQEYSRDKLKHKFIFKSTKLGKIKFRVSGRPFKKETPEYEDCLKIARKLNIPLLQIYSSITHKT